MHGKCVRLREAQHVSFVSVSEDYSKRFQEDHKIEEARNKEIKPS